jgi:dTDP-D-glucose 4,6-dehydratase
MGKSINKVFVPPKVMNEIWDNGQASQYLIQRVAPYIHPWNESTLFSIDRLCQDIGWHPEYDFAAAVEQTWRWYRETALYREPAFDWSPEDELLARLT